MICGDTEEAVGMAVLAGEQGRGLAGAQHEGREGATIVGDKDVKGGDAGAGCTVAVIRAGPAHGDFKYL